MRPLLLLFSLVVSLSAAAETLPLVEVPAAKPGGDTLVVFVSGDGGWAAIDKSMARVFADHGLPVVGLNALQYFWKKRTPEAASRDLQTIVVTYLAKWNKSRAVIAGYSRGADVLPAMINRMPADVQSRIRLVALLGPSPFVEYEFHMSDWLHDRKGGSAVKPELARIRDRKVLCLWGEDDKDSLCRGLAQPNVHVVTLKGAHHFDGSYEKLAAIILDELP